jgi:glycosyltransferase involved in cell wall biosynthesis
MEPVAPVRIVHADTDDVENPLRGGQPVRTLAVNERLAVRHQIIVFTSVYRRCRRRVERRGVLFRRLGFRLAPFGLSPHLTFLAALGPAVARTPHELVVEEFTPPLGFCGLPWWTRAPVVLSVQWNFFDQWERRYRLPFRRWMRRWAATGRYRYVIVQSDAMRREMAAILPHAIIRTIPAGVDDSAFHAEVSGGTYALFVGRLDIEHKGLDLLIDAWRRVGAEIPLVIAGEGPDRPALEEMIARAGLTGTVRLLGRVEGPAKRQAFAGSRFVLVPSRYETFGLAALEAMAAGKPLICFDIEHLNEVAAPPWARRVSPLDVAALADAAIELWRNPDRCGAMGSAGQRQARSYHWNAIARQQEEFYLEAAACTA